jgi:hypothetical protein
MMGAPTTPSRRPFGVAIMMAVSALGAVAALPVAIGLVLGLIDIASIGLGSTGLSGSALALGLLVYTAFGLFFAYGLWTLRRWAWWFGLVFLAGSVVSDVIAPIAGWQPPLLSAAFVAVGLLVLGYWLRASVRTAFRS